MYYTSSTDFISKWRCIIPPALTLYQSGDVLYLDSSSTDFISKSRCIILYLDSSSGEANTRIVLYTETRRKQAVHRFNTLFCLVLRTNVLNHLISLRIAEIPDSKENFYPWTIYFSKRLPFFPYIFLFQKSAFIKKDDHMSGQLLSTRGAEISDSKENLINPRITFSSKIALF